jgi:TonB family protein
MKALLLALIVVTASSAFAAAGADSLTLAKELYATAAYEDALSTLTELRKSATASPAELIQLDQYRVFCLFALGRRAEAEAHAQSMVRIDPFFKPADEDTSPAISALFAAARKQTLPAVIRERYKAGKAAVDREDFAQAEPLLEDVRRLIAEWTTVGSADESINDLAVLADGFLTLARAAESARRLPLAKPNPSGTSPDADVSGSKVSGAPAWGEPVSAYSPGSPGVTAPVVILQALPPIPTQYARLPQKRGVLEVTIDVTGHVADVIVREATNPGYDRLAVDAAKRWQYKPAMKDGQPVRYVKTIAVQFKVP